MSWICSKPLFRKGQDDGDYRLARRGNSGTSRHQLLLPHSPTSCYSPAPSRRGARSDPQVSCQRHTQTSTQPNGAAFLTGHGVDWEGRWISRQETEFGWQHFAYLGFLIGEPETAAGKENKPRGEPGSLSCSGEQKLGIQGWGGRAGAGAASPSPSGRKLVPRGASFLPGPFWALTALGPWCS